MASGFCRSNIIFFYEQIMLQENGSFFIRDKFRQIITSGSFSVIVGQFFFEKKCACVGHFNRD